MNNDIVISSTTTIDPTNADYLLGIHEQDLQEHGERLSVLEEALKRINDRHEAATVTKIMRHDSPSPMGWAFDNESAGAWSSIQTPYLRPELYLSQFRMEELKWERSTPTHDIRHDSVPLWALLQFGSALMALTAGGSILFWLLGSTPILSPFVSLLTLVASPFTYLMGVAAKKR
jgi:hypothetical protein